MEDAEQAPFFADYFIKGKDKPLITKSREEVQIPILAAKNAARMGRPFGIVFTTLPPA
jgi:hypothetical protein